MFFRRAGVTPTSEKREILLHKSRKRNNRPESRFPGIEKLRLQRVVPREALRQQCTILYSRSAGSYWKCQCVIDIII